MKRTSASIYALVSLMIVIWSFNFIVTKTVAAHLPGPFLACLRTVVAGLCLAPIYFRMSTFHGSRTDLWKLIGLGAAGIAFNQILFVVGIAQTSVAHGAIITALAPVQVLLLAVLVGHEQMNARKAIGIAIAFTGVAWLQLGKSSNAGATFRGDFLMYLGTLFFAFFSVFGKSYTKRMGSLTVTGIGFIAAAVVAAPFALYTGLSVDFARVPAIAWLGLAYMAVFSSVIGYLIFNYALAHVPASRVAAFLYTQPIVATLMGWIFLNEPLTIALAISTGLVLLGLYVVERAR
jgi:drug/metabolite transporter (DMT)-like permease